MNLSSGVSIFDTEPVQASGSFVKAPIIPLGLPISPVETANIDNSTNSSADTGVNSYIPDSHDLVRGLIIGVLIFLVIKYIL